MAKYPFPKQIAIVCKHISEQLKDIQVSATKLQSHDHEFLTLLTAHLTTYLNKTHSGTGCECFKVKPPSPPSPPSIDPDTTFHCNCEDKCRSVCQVEISHLRHQLQLQHETQVQCLEESVRALQERMSADMAQLNMLFQRQQQLRDGRMRALPTP